MGAVTGLGVGVFQALVLSRSRVSGAFWWAVANAPAWTLGWLVTSYVITRNVQEQFTNFGASGSLVFGLLTWLLLTVLFREPEPEATQSTYKTPPAPSPSRPLRHAVERDAARAPPTRRSTQTRLAPD
jgi:hypothetical protein